MPALEPALALGLLVLSIGDRDQQSLSSRQVSDQLVVMERQVFQQLIVVLDCEGFVALVASSLSFEVSCLEVVPQVSRGEVDQQVLVAAVMLLAGRTLEAKEGLVARAHGWVDPVLVCLKRWFGRRLFRSFPTFRAFPLLGRQDSLESVVDADQVGKEVLLVPEKFVAQSAVELGFADQGQ